MGAHLDYRDRIEPAAKARMTHRCWSKSWSWKNAGICSRPFAQRWEPRTNCIGPQSAPTSERATHACRTSAHSNTRGCRQNMSTLRWHDQEGMYYMLDGLTVKISLSCASPACSETSKLEFQLQADRFKTACNQTYLMHTDRNAMISTKPRRCAVGSLVFVLVKANRSAIACLVGAFSSWFPMQLNPPHLQPFCASHLLAPSC
jgi:hypothetical protein